MRAHGRRDWRGRGHGHGRGRGRGVHSYDNKERQRNDFQSGPPGPGGQRHGGEQHGERPHEQWPIGYKRLEEMVQKDEPRDIVIKLSSERSGLQQRLGEDGGKMGDGMIQMLLQVFGKMSESEGPPQAMIHVLKLIVEYEFHQKIITFILGLITEQPARRNRAPMHVQNSLKLLLKLLTTIPQTSLKQVKMTIIMLQTVVDELDLIASVHDILAEVKLALALYEQQPKTTKSRREPAGTEEDDMTPPNNFRDIPVFPQLRDIHGEGDKFLRANLVDRGYKDVDHYLDVQYRLLREDFIRPLREGISEIMHYDESNHRGRKVFFQNVKVYTDVRIEFKMPTQRGIVHRLHFNTDTLKNVRWQNTKRLLYGNLLCLSSDHFKEHVLFAVVADRKPEELAYGYITVEFVQEEEEEIEDDDSDQEFDDLAGFALPAQARRRPAASVDMKKLYTMVETDAYFEAYRHVLAGLKETHHIPLERYIVSCEKIMYAPEYLRPSVAGGHVRYNLSSVVQEDMATSEQLVDVLGTDWPTPEDFQLDKTQAAALELALTKELAIIQGPPGTGKTYVGLQIMKVLLANKGKWFTARDKLRSRDKNAPILVVCYTNHALDQFLEGIAEFCTKDQIIVRVGGRCKNEITKEFSLAQIRRKQRNSKERGKDNLAQRRAMWELHSSLREIEIQIGKNCNMLEASLHCVQGLSELEEVIPQHLLRQFQVQGDMFWSNSDPRNVCLLQWLGLDNTPEAPDYSQMAAELPQLTVAILVSMDHTLEQIGEAYYLSGEHDVMILDDWIKKNAQKTRPGAAGSQVQDYSQAVNQVPELTVALLVSMGYTQNQIGKAYHFTGQQDMYDLMDWIENNKQDEAAAGNADARNADVDDESDEEVGIDEEATLMEEQRLLETDEDLYTPSKSSKKPDDNDKQVKQIMNKMAAITFEEVGGRSKANEEGGWETTRHDKKKAKKKVRAELGKTSVMTPEEEVHVTNIYNLNPLDRWRLYRTWVDRWRDKFRIASDRYTEKYNNLARRLQELRREEDAQILQSADVVAVTTTGAAKYRDMIYRLNTKIVVVEEAAEVLEAHIVTAMPETTKHLILIGDHQQLKPSPTVYELAKKFNLDTSLFERMIKSTPHVTLELQHRMRPEIADLLRPNIYKNLKDHESVFGRDDITGIQKPLFFVSHNVMEESVQDGRSKKNQFEAEFLVRLCLYIIMQGYKPEQITVLVMYTGQLFAFRNYMKSQACRGVRVTAVDNFQGEENDVILLSLVRSNEEEKIGFLSIENRICVALSRAKYALYCIGNMDLLRKKSSMWRKIVSHLRVKDCIGDALMLQCKNHPDKLTPARHAKDFDKVPEGGCGQPCETRLDCGHVCARSCHPDDHAKYQCRKPCDKILCEYGHRCKKKCYEDCGQCMKLVSKTLTLCGHKQNVPCYMEPAMFNCKSKEKVELQCGHEAEVTCSEKRYKKQPVCRVKCATYLTCKDLCNGSCHECSQGRLHIPCNTKCSRILVCGHECGSPCPNHCSPCSKMCKIRCEHSKCNKECGEPCNLCREPCEWKCKHFKCAMLCSEPCNRPPCNQPCTKKIKRCNHQCIGLCGETCPTLCRTCDKDKVTDVFFGDEDDADARFVQLEDCKHIFTYESLDQWMNQEEQSGAIKMKECPRCKTPIFRSRRYGKIINAILNSVNEVKVKTYGNAARLDINKRLLYFDTVNSRTKLQETFANEILQIESTLQKKERQSQDNLMVLESEIRNLETLSKLKLELWKMQHGIITSKKLTAASQAIQTTATWVMLPRTHMTEQDSECFKMEVERISKMLQFTKVDKKYRDSQLSTVFPRSSQLSQIFRQLEMLLFEDTGIYSTLRKTKVESYFEQIKKMAPELHSNLGITETERKMICQAMGFAAKGHWYKCPKGHVYAIGECGGATETSVCPECKSQIGGTSLRLLDTNRIATEMDGATRPAYDPYNFDIPGEFL